MLVRLVVTNNPNWRRDLWRSVWMTAVSSRELQKAHGHCRYDSRHEEHLLVHYRYSTRPNGYWVLGEDETFWRLRDGFSLAA